MKLTIFFPLAAFLSWAVAESIEYASPCLIRCLNEAATVAGCISQLDSKCTCPSIPFKDAVGDCLKASCTEADVKLAGELHKERCGTDPE